MNFKMIFKKLTKTISFMMFLFLTGCSIFNGAAHHKVKLVGEDSFPQNGKGIVHIKIVHDGRAKPASFSAIGTWIEAKINGETPQYPKENACTDWRKINDDKTEEKMFRITGSGNFIQRLFKSNLTDAKRYAVMLDSGTYVLANLSVVSGNKTYYTPTTTPWWKREGWDMLKNQPKIASFHVNSGEEIYLPTIHICLEEIGNQFSFEVDPDPEHLWTFGDYVKVRYRSNNKED